MASPIELPIAPMLAKAATSLPYGDQWRYEPKWDGFRCVVSHFDGVVELGSRNERPLTRYFPEVVAALTAAVPEGTVLDGELVIARADRRGLDFDALLQRIHPAVSRVNRLAAETPARFVAFDLLVRDGSALLAVPFDERRAGLVELHASLGADAGFVVTPLTADRDVAEDWFTRFEGAGLDGIVAKDARTPYASGERTMIKVKHERTADCVVAGYRVHKDGNGVGSLLLGLHDEAGHLHHVGVAASFTAKMRRELLGELSALVDTELSDHPWRDWALASAHEVARLPGAQSRWSAGKDLSFVAVRPERVAEVQFSQLQGNRFRHGTSFIRWRPDRDPQSCRYSQLEVAEAVDLERLLAQ
jgi:ATP-dependent DNA ligase